MACCVIAAFVINKIITACEVLHLGLDIQYNDAFQSSTSYGDDGSSRNGPSNPFTTKLSLTGMTCSACTATVDSTLRSVPGVVEVKVSLQLQQVLVLHCALAGAEQLKDAVEQAGYGAEIGPRSTDATLAVLHRKKELTALRESFSTATMLLCVIFSISTLAPASRMTKAWMSWLSVTSLGALNVLLQLRAGRQIYSNAWGGTMRGRLNMDSMIALSSAVGLALSLMSITIHGSQADTYFQTTAALITVVLGGRYLDSMSRKQTGESLLQLLSNRAESAMIGSGSRKRRVAASFLDVGDEITIEAHSVIPCDCYVLEGTSEIDESIISGESTLLLKTPGSTLLSGSRNGKNVLIAQVIKEQEQSTLATMIHDISETTDSKVSSQELADAVIPWFALGVMTLAVVRSAIAFWLMDGGIPVSTRINVVGKSFMTILTAACPCAIGLSVPSAIMAAVDSAWHHGILIVGGGSVLERLGEITCIVMDKTGTLTRGTHVVQGQDLSSTWTKDFSKFCLLICATEEPGAAVHPIGRAIFQHYFQQSPSARHFNSHCTILSRTEIPGQGMFCTLRLRDTETHTVLLGNPLLLSNLGIPIPSSHASLPVSSTTVPVYVAINGTYAGRILLTDTIRPDVPPTLSALLARNLYLTILTGDSAPEASRISEKLSLPLLAFRASPSQKAVLIKQLQSQGHKVAMIGDGINDALALAAADVGIMMATDSAQCATLGGHILILSPRFASLEELFRITERVGRQVRRNLLWAAGYNVVALGLACGAGESWGISINPPMGAALMSVSSLGVVVGSLAMRRGLVGVKGDGRGVGKGS